MTLPLTWLDEVFSALRFSGPDGVELPLRRKVQIKGSNVTSVLDEEGNDRTVVDLSSVTSISGDGSNVDITCAQTTWGIATSGIIAKILPAPVITTDATPSTLLVLPIPEDTVVDYAITVVGRRSGGASGAAGDSYRSDLVCTYQRIGSAAPTLVGAAAAETNKRSNGGGSAYAASVAIVGNNIVVSGVGAATTTIHWTAVIQGQQVG
jgi:hypothetical protein